MNKQPDSSNLQGLENDQPIPRGDPNEILNFDSNKQKYTVEHQPTGEIIKEKSDICRLLDEDLRSRVDGIESGEDHPTENSKTSSCQTTNSEYDPAVHCDSKIGRLHLTVRYDSDKSQLIIHLIDAEGIIRPEQLYAPEMRLLLSLVGNNTSETCERMIVQNAAVRWEEPVIFPTMYEQAIEQSLYISLTNRTDPSTPRDREVSIPLNNLKEQDEEIDRWFDLQFVQST